MHTRPSRRATKLCIAALVGFSLITAACGGSDDDGTDTAEIDTTEAEVSEDAAPEETTGVVEGEIEVDVVEVDDDPVPGGTLRYGLEADVDGLNPTSSALSSPGLMMANAVFDTLAAFNDEGVAVPYLAESIEPVGGDFSKWQVKLREGITFHDGEPLNIDAVLLNFETQRADPLVGLAVKPFYPEVGAAERIDDMTAQFNLLEPNAYFPGQLAGQLGYVASPKWLEAALADPTLNQQPIGTGPFVYDSRSPDSVTRFVRNPDWWNGDVWLDAIEFVPVTDPDTRVDLLQQDDLNALQTSDPGAVLELRDDESVQNIVDEQGEESFVMLNSSVPPFDDIRARRALALATPQQSYLDLIGLGVTRQATQRFIPESVYYNPDLVQEGDSPDEAIAVAAEYCAEFAANCSDSKINMEYQISGPSVVGTQEAELLIQGWKSAFNVTLQELPQDQHIQEAALGQYNAVDWRQFGAEDPSIDNVWLLCRTVGFISLNWPKFCDEERDALLLEAQATEDQARRVELYQEVSAKINQDYLYIFQNHTVWDNAFADNVRGVCDRQSPGGDLLRCVTNGRNWFSSIWIAE
jgi:peptide/nickel transport system substrate-binding protein